MSRGRVACRLVFPILKALEMKGFDRSTVLRRAGVHVRCDDPAGLVEQVSLARYLAVWDVALALAPGGITFDAACAVGPEGYGVIGFACMASPTLGEAFLRSSRYHGVCTDSSRWRVEVDEKAAVTALIFEQDGEEGPARDAAVEFALAEALHQARGILGPQVRPARVELTRTTSEALEAQTSYYGAPVALGSARNALVMANRTLDHAMPRSDPHLLAFLEAQARLLPTSQPEGAEGPPLRAVVGRAIAEALPSGTPGMEDVAARLGLSGRTLRRRLAEESTSFQAVLEDTRTQLAGRYLERRDLALPEIAFLLGFSEPSPFFRAFRRWYGVSPERYRAQAAAGRGALA